MNNFYPGLYATPFHLRMAERNINNAWDRRGIYTLSRYFGNAETEALALHFSAVLADMTSFGRLRVTGTGAARLLSAACKCDVAALPAGQAREVFWTNDGGGLRGNGTLARFGEENFVLKSYDTDIEWFGAVATQFGAAVRNEHAERAELLLAGPQALAILEAAGLGTAPMLGPQHHEIVEWNGISLTISRHARLDGFDLNCTREDGIILFDRLIEAGRPHALSLIGQEALELLYLEAGLVLAGLDYLPARDNTSETPKAAALGFGGGNGSAVAPEKNLVGVEWDGSEPASCAALLMNGIEVGRTLRSAYSPALKRVISLASITADHAQEGTSLSIRLPSDLSKEPVAARVVELPFLSQGLARNGG